MEQYIKNGKEIYKKFCKPDPMYPDRVVMLPRAPQQTYIDVYPEHDDSFRDDKRRQVDYEAEVLVYRALERLNGDFIVLHSFEYTHHQYRLCDKNHDRKNCAKCKSKYATDRHGECDFLVVCNNCFVVIEVKNMQNQDHDDCEPHLFFKHTIELECMTQDEKLQLRNGLNKTLKKSLEQREKIVKLIKSIDEDMKVLEYTAYPNLPKKLEYLFHHPEKTSVIFKEDFKNFINWWSTKVMPNVGSKDGSVTKFNRVRDILLAIWCTDKDNCDKRRCSLGWSIKQIHEKLRNGQFVYRKNAPKSVPAPSLLKECFGVENLTKEQFDVFSSKKKFLWINGPAGAGKTLILAGRMIEFIRNDKKNKIVLFTFCRRGEVSNLYQKALKKTGIRYQVICHDKKDMASDLQEKVAECKKNNQVTIISLKNNCVSIPWFMNVVTSVHDCSCSLFIDDIQAIEALSINKASYDGILIGLMETLLSSSSKMTGENYIIVACDVSQAWVPLKYDANGNIPPRGAPPYRFDSRRPLPLTTMIENKEIFNLTSNMRNTANMSKVLDVVRKSLMAISDLASFNCGFMSPHENEGHYIHGPQIVVYLIDHTSPSADPSFLINDIVAKEINHLFKDAALDRSEIGLLWNSDYVFSFLSDSIVESLSSSHVDDCFSAEFPVAIILHEMKGGSDCNANSGQLYLAMSRALVYCVVILIEPKVRTRYVDDEWSATLIPQLGRLTYVTRYIDEQALQRREMFINSEYSAPNVIGRLRMFAAEHATQRTTHPFNSQIVISADTGLSPSRVDKADQLIAITPTRVHF